MPPIQWENNFQQKIQQYLANQQANSSSKIAADYTIPVVVHVVYWNGTENISQAQIISQISILNADFAGTGLNSGNVPSVFASLKSNTNISFCLAKKAPDGSTMSEPGIHRVNAQTKGFSNPTGSTKWTSDYIDNNIKPNTIWDAKKYMNIWIVPCIWDEDDNDCSVLGYATFPAGTGLTGLSGLGTATTDGVVVSYECFGNTGTVLAPYNKGRTTTHEIGHWLGLRHIWGDSNCGNDYCDDTPKEKTANFDCQNHPFQVNGCGAGSSPNGVMFMNFMDYTEDACMYMFTNDQRTRIQTTMQNGTYRAPLATSNVCSSAPQAPVANFTASTTNVCPGNTVQFADASSDAPTSWSWSFPSGTPSTSTSKNPLITYSTAGTYTVTLTATNNIGSDGETKTNYITVVNQAGAALPLVQGFESSTFPPTGWSLNSNSGFNWERNTVVSGFGNSVACMKFNNTENDGSFKKDDILSPTLSISNVSNPRIKFDVAHAPYDDGVTWDTLEVLIRDVCTGLTTSIYKKGGNQLATASAIGEEFIPKATEWRKDSVNISASFLNKSVKFIFRNYGSYGHSIYVDNINVYGTAVATGTPTASFTSSTNSICVGQSITFTSTSTASIGQIDSIRWTIPNGTPSTGTSTPISLTFNTVGNFNITLKAYKSGNVSTATQAITIKAKPTVTVSSASICSGQSAVLQASGATTYSWSPGNSTNNPFTTPALTVNTNYTVTGTTNGCSNSAISTVTIKPKLSAPTISQRNDTLTCSNVSGISYKWYLNGNLIKTTTQNFIKITQNGGYTVEVIGANECTSVRSGNFNASLTGIKNNRLDIEYSIIPNPNNGLFEIKISSTTTKTYQLKLVNVSGQIILSEELKIRAGQNSKSINVIGLEKGMYLLNLIGDDGLQTQQIIIQ